MRPLRVIEFVSLDGVMQAPGDPQEDTEGGFRHGGWQRAYADEVLGAVAGEGMARTDAYLFGRKTYEKMASYWPFVGDDDPYAAHLNRTPKYVASTTLGELDWSGAEVLEGDVPAAVARLKDRPDGAIAVLGSGVLVPTLLAHGLVDELMVAVFPLLLGGGKRLFADDGERRDLRLVDSRTTTTGGAVLTYRPA